MSSVTDTPPKAKGLLWVPGVLELSVVWGLDYCEQALRKCLRNLPAPSCKITEQRGCVMNVCDASN